MDHAATVMLAIDLFHVPSQVRLMRSAPLPDGVSNLLHIAAGDEALTGQASDATGRPRERVREAAAFFIEQMLLHPEADSYRVLGVRSDASSDELRRNMALLVRWLHPDLDPQGQRSVFAHRVTRAWNDLKTDERRSAYDRSRRMTLAQESLSRKKARASSGSRAPMRRPYSQVPHRRPLKPDLSRLGLLRRVLLLLLGRIVH